MPTLADVAKLAKVSIVTASKAMNDNPSVRSYLRERVKKAAAELNYRPNRMAQGLRRQSSNLISIGIQQMDNPYFGTMTQELCTCLLEHDYASVVCNSIGRVNEMNRKILARGTILITPDGWAIDQTVQENALVTIAGSERRASAPNVKVQLSGAYRDVGTALREEGRRHVVLCCPVTQVHWEMNYIHKFAHLEEALGQGTLKAYSTPQDLVAALSAGEEIDAVVCMNDVVAFELFHELCRAGHAPGTIRIVGCDGTVSVPGAWTITTDVRAVCSTAVDLLLRTINGEVIPEDQLPVFTPQLSFGGC